MMLKKKIYLNLSKLQIISRPKIKKYFDSEIIKSYSD